MCILIDEMNAMWYNKIAVKVIQRLLCHQSIEVDAISTNDENKLRKS